MNTLETHDTANAKRNNRCVEDKKVTAKRLISCFRGVLSIDKVLNETLEF